MSTFANQSEPRREHLLIYTISLEAVQWIPLKRKQDDLVTSQQALSIAEREHDYTVLLKDELAPSFHYTIGVILNLVNSSWFGLESGPPLSSLLWRFTDLTWL